jgi:hypothetical protein
MRSYPFNMTKYNIGDEVYWNDPDNGSCSGFYEVVDILNPTTIPSGAESPVYKLRALLVVK